MLRFHTDHDILNRSLWIIGNICIMHRTYAVEAAVI